ncbi:MAG: diguanylate cyclase [Cyanobacteria bacterium J06635_15]
MRFLSWQGPKNLPLRWVLIVPFVIEIFLSVGLVGWLSFRHGQKSANTLANDLSHEVALSIEKHILDFADTHHLFLQINAAAIRTQNLRTENFDQLEQYFWEQVQLTETVAALYFADRDGDFVLVTVDEEPRVYIRDQSTAPWRHIYRLDESGNRANLIKTQAYEPRERPWYLAAAAYRDATWSEIYTFAARPVLGITPALPIYDNDGTLQGVLAADITLRQISQFLQGLDIGKTGEAFIMERSGHLVASSSLETPLIAAEVSANRRLAVQSHTESISDTAAFVRQHFDGFDQIQSPQRLEAYFDGVKHFVQVVPLQDERGLDWLMVVVIPVTDFMGTVNANARSSLILGAIAIAIAIGSTILITYWITKPVLIVGKAAQAIAAGELDQHVPVDCVAEINQLIGSFNDMSSQLKSSFTALAQANQTLESQVEQRTAQLQTLALTDSLTQVFNRRGFDFFLHSTWEDHGQTQQPLSLIFCDVDYFKAYNDTYGHVAGDECLKAIAATLSQKVRLSSTLVARYGGEEFVIVLPNTPATDAIQIAERLRTKIIQMAIPHSASPEGYITASFGIASQIPNASSNPINLVRKADNALYTAKHRGRNQIVGATVEASYT